MYVHVITTGTNAVVATPSHLTVIEAIEQLFEFIFDHGSALITKVPVKRDRLLAILFAQTPAGAIRLTCEADQKERASFNLFLSALMDQESNAIIKKNEMHRRAQSAVTAVLTKGDTPATIAICSTDDISRLWDEWEHVFANRVSDVVPTRRSGEHHLNLPKHSNFPSGLVNQAIYEASERISA